MRSFAPSFVLRVACAVSVSALLTVGPIGCSGNSAPATGTQSELVPEVQKANNAMEEFQKSKAKK